MSDNEAVLVERIGHVMVATINRPEARNAVNQDVASGLGHALDDAENDDQIWVFIVTGAGDRAFCAGADLKALSRGDRREPADPRVTAWGFGGYTRHPISKPTIAAVNGFALGGGSEICLASDMIVAAETASFGLPEVKRGIIAAAGGAFRLPQQLPKKVAMEMIMTGDRITAQRAYELGFVNRVVPEGQALEGALELAQAISVNAPLAVQASKRIANGIINGQVSAEDPTWDLNDSETATVMKSADAKEGPLAFAEKRDPVWQAR
jgi:crotonobetainyl-CoA hydratase